MAQDVDIAILTIGGRVGDIGVLQSLEAIPKRASTRSNCPWRAQTSGHFRQAAGVYFPALTRGGGIFIEVHDNPAPPSLTARTRLA